jgi:hypothetical protein
MKRVFLIVALLLSAVPAFAQNTSTAQMSLVNSATFTNRLQYLMAQQAATVLIEAQSDGANADTFARYTAGCHTLRVSFAQSVLASPSGMAAASAVLIAGGNFAGGVIVGTVIVQNGLADSSANDTALAKAITDNWNSLAKCVTNP